MHLTRISLNKNTRGGTKLLSNPQAMHAAVEGCFPPEANPVDGPGRTLWRIDRAGNHTHLYITSAARPDPTSIVEQAGWPASDTPGYQTRDYSEPLANLAAGGQYAFKIAVNPQKSVKSLAGERSARSPRLPVHGEQNIIEWFMAKDIGAVISAVRITSTEQVVVKRENNSPKINHCVLTGVLTVVDAGKLRAALTSGVGHSKAYGCGLMTLAPVRANK